MAVCLRGQTNQGTNAMDYESVTADKELESDLRALVRLAIQEDLRDQLDWTTACLIGDEVRGACQIVPRGDGVCAGLVTVPWIVDEFRGDLELQTLSCDGEALVPNQPIMTLRGNVQDLLTVERTVLNILSRLCGVATLTASYASLIRDYPTRLYDTRKTTPGWRLLEKYAVRCGGGNNHRRGLYDGFLIKDNHLALGGNDGVALAAGEAADKAIAWRGMQRKDGVAPSIVEIEVDSLEQLNDVLPSSPDIVLVDNFSIDMLNQAVEMRNSLNPKVELEASGNVTRKTIVEIAKTGVDRISSGALTHQATWLDLGLDWLAS